MEKMADQFTPERGTGPLEADMDRIAGDIEKYRQAPETKDFSQEQLLKKAVHELTEHPMPTGQGSTSAANDDSDYAKGASAGAKLEVDHYLSMAFKDGILKAANEAKKSNPFVLDAFHDALTGKLYDEFKRRGLLK